MEEGKTDFTLPPAIPSLVCVLLLAAMGCSRPPGQRIFPNELAGSKLVRFVGGREAVEQIRGMHRGSFTVENVYIAAYEGEGGEITIWISESPSADEALMLVMRMAADIGEGDEIFRNTGAFTVGDITVYSATGMGQRHYYYQRDKKIVWIAARKEGTAERALHELFRRIK